MVNIKAAFKHLQVVGRGTLTLVVLIAGLVGGLMVSKVDASVTLSPDPGSIPESVRVYLRNADNEPRTPSLQAWLSGLDDPSLSSVTVSYFIASTFQMASLALLHFGMEFRTEGLTSNNNKW